jgi:hypothetical protein
MKVFCCVKAAARVEWAENDPYICCFKSANEVLSLFYFNEAICKFANFQHMHMEGVRSGRVWALSMLQMPSKTDPKWPNCLKIAKSKSQLLHTLEFKEVKSKNGILHGEVLVKDECIFGKRGTNGACRKKPH